MQITLTVQFMFGIQRQGSLQFLWKDTQIKSVLSLFHQTAGISSEPLRITPFVFILSTVRGWIFIVFPQYESYVTYMGTFS